MANTHPMVSVIVPSYNHAPFLRVCLESALSQDHQDLEVVLVDDKSSDESLAIARSIQDSRLRVFANDANLGAYATQNRALDEAKGEWIAVLNSDDLWRPGKMASQMALLQRSPDATLCYTLGSQIDESGATIGVDQHAHWPKSERQDLLPLMLSSNRLLASSVIFRKGAVRFEPSLRYSGDWVAWLSLAEKGEALCVAEDLTAWRQHEANSYTRSKEVTLEEIRVRRAILTAAKRWTAAREDKGAVRKGLSECGVDLTALFVLIGNMRKAKQSAGLAMRLAPGNTVAHKRMVLSLMPAVLARRRLWAGDSIKVAAKELASLPPLTVPEFT